MPNNPVQVPDLTRPLQGQPQGQTRFGLLQAGAGLFTLIWLLGIGLYVWSGLSPAGALGIGVTGLVTVLPIALAWFVVANLTAIGHLRAEAAQLQNAVENLRQSQSTNPPQATPRQADRKQAGHDTPLAFASRRDTGLTVASADRKTVLAAPRAAMLMEEQPGLALGTPLEDAPAPLAVADVVRALHFPESPDDIEGFRALRLALADRTMAKLIRAAQDVLTLLAQEGIYMDDLSPDRARPELWRKFAAGERGRPIAGLGGLRDRSCLALTAARMREDAVFRDAAHHFLRSFDKAMVELEPRATDTELTTLSDTRTARAFMLFGRVTGTFD